MLLGIVLKSGSEFACILNNLIFIVLILIDISDLIKSGWYGIISRKTTTSETFYRDALAKFEDI